MTINFLLHLTLYTHLIKSLFLCCCAWIIERNEKISDNFGILPSCTKIIFSYGGSFPTLISIWNRCNILYSSYIMSKSLRNDIWKITNCFHKSKCNLCLAAFWADEKSFSIHYVSVYVRRYFVCVLDWEICSILGGVVTTTEIRNKKKSLPWNILWETSCSRTPAQYIYLHIR